MAAAVLAVQRQAGNRSANAAIQAKLVVGRADDPFERAADVAADAALRRLAAGTDAPASTDDDAATVRRRGHDRAGDPGGATVEAGAEQRIRNGGGGAGLPGPVLERMERGFDADFSGVRIHSDDGAAGLAADLGARAFTLGSDIWFGKGEFAPSSASGERVLAHELAHVLQQGGARAGGSGPAVRRLPTGTHRPIQRLLSTTVVADVRSGDLATGSDLVVPKEFVELADHIHKMTTAVGSGSAGGDWKTFGNLDSFANSAGAKGSVGGVGALFGTMETIAGGAEGVSGISNLAKGIKGDDSFKRNLGAQQLESGLTGGLGGGLNTAKDIISAGASETPFVDVAANAYGAVTHTKAAIEDSVASAKLGRQKTHIKHERDQAMPMSVRKTRFEEFRAQYAARIKALQDIDTAKAMTVRDTTGATGGITTAEQALKAGTAPQVTKAIAAFRKAQPNAADPTGAGLNAFVVWARGKKLAPFDDTSKPVSDHEALVRDLVTKQGALTSATNALTAAKANKTSDEQAKATALKAAKDALARAKKDMKRGDFERFKDALVAFKGTGGAPDPSVAGSDPSTFLTWCRTEGVKDFGYGTEHREQFEESVQAGSQTPDEAYSQMGTLKSFAGFGQRRKGETATVHAVEGAGNALDLAGTFTAAGDFGATKASGKLLKAGAAAYKGIKSGVKRARRVHKLRTARNEMGYGDDPTNVKERGVLWGMKMFFGGDIEKSMKKSREALAGRTTSGGKKMQNSLSPDRIKALKQRLTLQCLRQINAFLDCLCAKDAVVRARAKKIVHIVAETNLAGAIAKLSESDLDAFYAMSPNGSAPDPAKFKLRKKTLKELLERQLHGIGG